MKQSAAGAAIGALTILLLSVNAFPQSSDLRALARERAARSAEERLRARALAEKGGWQARGVSPGGVVFELQKMRGMMPLFYGTTNENAARTTRTDSLRILAGGGDGFPIGLWDGDAARATHQELSPRVVWADDEPLSYGDHATHVAGTMIGAGVKPGARGMAPTATVRSYEWNDDLAEIAAAAAEGLAISNHSYGFVRGWENLSGWYWFGDTALSATEDYLFGFYDDESAAWDEVAAAAPYFLIVTSASNDRNDAVPPGTLHKYFDVRTGTWVYSTTTRDPDGGALGYDCIPNGMQTAKNVLTVGAVLDVPAYTVPADVGMTTFSSWGPADDGRIKPDVCGNGYDVYSSIATSDTAHAWASGTSMASPNVCGTLALLQKHYRDVHVGAAMRGSTLKALAIHTAREAGAAPGPDYGFGWGLLDAVAAYEAIELDRVARRGTIEEFVLNSGSPLEFVYACDGTSPELRVTIAWYDPPGTPPAPALDPPDAMLVNDLDVRVEREGGPTFLPWTLDPGDPAAPASTGDNVSDNVEQIAIAGPAAGLYRVRISNKGTLAGGTQPFSLIVTGAERQGVWSVHSDGSGDAPSIAAAVDSAEAGDIIFVFPGTYFEHDITIDKPLLLKGISGPDMTVVDGQLLGRCLHLVAGADSARIEDLTFENGSVSGGAGGAVLIEAQPVTISNCTLKNCAAAYGGGIAFSGSAGVMRNCRVLDNAAEYGGGIALLYDTQHGSGCAFEGTLVSWNRASAAAGGILLIESAPVFTGCTVAYNSSPDCAGNIWIDWLSDLTMENSIVAFSFDGGGICGDSLFPKEWSLPVPRRISSPPRERGTMGAGAALSCCDVFGNVGGNYRGGIVDQTGSDGNISEDPVFCDPLARNFDIGDGSPCRPDGNGCGVTMGSGAVSCHSRTLWRIAADGSGDAPTIQEACDRASDGDTILLAPGVYTGEGNRDISFSGKRLLVRSEKGADSTVIDCGPLGAHLGFYLYSGEDTLSVIEGITVTNAANGGVRCANGSGATIRDCTFSANVSIGGSGGGGVYIENGRAKVLACRFLGNAADPNGGGMTARTSNVRVEDCLFSGNSAAKYGGALQIYSNSLASVKRCIFTGNSAQTESGGGIYVVTATVSVDSCIFAGNSGKFGGGLFNGTLGAATVRNCVFSGNAASNSGGGVYSTQSMMMRNCTLVGNTAVYFGSAIECQFGDRNSIQRSIVAFNESAAAIYTISGVLGISCSDVYGNAAGNYSGTTPDQTGLNSNFSLDPLFCDRPAGDLAIFEESPCAAAQSPCGQLVGAHAVGCAIAPNLAVSLVAPSDPLPAAKDTIAVTVTVKNLGVTPAGGFDVDLFENRATPPASGEGGDRRIRVDTLAVGDSATVVFSGVTSASFGQWTMYAAADPQDAVHEAKETDNAGGPCVVSWMIPREAGWPAAAGGTVRSAPALADLDGVPETLEIVAGSDGGAIHAWGADGEPLDGWPVDLGDTIRSAPAVGDIAGDSRAEVVVGCDDGSLYALAADGSVLWSKPTGSPVAATPALADLDGDGGLEIVCGSRDTLFALEGNGSACAGAWPLFLGGTSVTSAAVGDVDGDAVPEIAVAANGLAGPGSAALYLFESNGAMAPGWPFSFDGLVLADPVIGDISAPHDRFEIAVAATDGTVFAFDASGNPLFEPVRAAGTAAAGPILANFDRDGYHDIVVASQTPAANPPGTLLDIVTIVSSAGGIASAETLSSWPHAEGPLAPPIAIGSAPTLVTASPDGRLSADLYGFPLVYGWGSYASPAAGDIDGDGAVEIVAASDSLYCFELCSPAFPAGALPWPTFRRSASRTAFYGYEPAAGTDDKGGDAPPAATRLSTVYPNPFNPTVRIGFDVEKRGRVNLAIYDVTGRRIALLVDGILEAGRHEATWDGRASSGVRATSGIYFARLAAGSVRETRKIVLLR